MKLLIIGVLILISVLLYPSVFKARRDAIAERLGKKFNMIYGICIAVSIALIIVGWKLTVPEHVYQNPSWGRELNMFTMFFAILLFGAGSSKGISRIKQFVRYPMILAAGVWATGHLLANGDIRSLILFGGALTWSVIAWVAASRCDGAWVKPSEIAGFKREFILLIITVVVYLVLFMSHRFFAGIPLIYAT